MIEELKRDLKALATVDQPTDYTLRPEWVAVRAAAALQYIEALETGFGKIEASAVREEGIGIMEEMKIADTEKECYAEASESKVCFGNYIDEKGICCEDGLTGLCSYCVECRRVCVNV